VAEPNALTHYGVKGMKWGKRKSEDGGSSKPPASEDAALASKYKTTAKKAGTKALSNAELKILVDRMNLERQYSSLNPSVKKVAGKAVADMLVQMGKQEVRRIAQDQITKTVAKAMAGR